MKTLKKLVLVLTATSMILQCGCGKVSKEEVSEESKLNFTGYPMITNVELDYWCPLHAPVSATSQNLGSTPFGKALQEKTGVKINFIHPPQGLENEQLSIILSSDDLPDIIENDWYGFSGGAQKAIDDGIIIPLNDIIENYSPNLKKYLSENSDIDRMVKVDDGSYYVYPFIRGNSKLLVGLGLFIREDWLNDLGLDMPETIDDWYNVLKQFKEKKGATAPLMVSGTSILNAFSGAYGIKSDFFLENGKIVFGAADPRYKEVLATFAKWYAEGLINENMTSVDSKIFDANLINGKSGASFGWAGGGMGTYMKAAMEKDPNAIFAPAPFVSANKGEIPLRGIIESPYPGGGSAAITSSCSNLEVAARFLDYGFSEEGQMLYNFGIEGESYNMVDGFPKYTEDIMRNPDGLTISQAMARYIRGNLSGPFLQRVEYVEQYYELPQQQDALTVYANTREEEFMLPRISFTSEESSVVAEIMSNINTFVDEKTIQYIMGKEDLATFDSYLETIKNYGLDQILQIYEDAYKRYQNR